MEPKKQEKTPLEVGAVYTGQVDKLGHPYSCIDRLGRYELIKCLDVQEISNSELWKSGTHLLGQDIPDVIVETWLVADIKDDNAEIELKFCRADSRHSYRVKKFCHFEFVAYCTNSDFLPEIVKLVYRDERGAIRTLPVERGAICTLPVERKFFTVANYKPIQCRYPLYHGYILGFADRQDYLRDGSYTGHLYFLSEYMMRKSEKQ